MTGYESRLAQMLAVHCDPKDGSPFWIERTAKMGLDPRREIASIEDLPRMGTMSPSDLADRPVEDFIPRSLIEERNEMVIAQTGGTLGRGEWTAYLQHEFEAAFVTPFVAAARHVGFPEGENWLYVGPSGPHVIGQAAQHIARAMGSFPPFAVDFDSRWAKKLPPQSFAAGRYLDHVVEQAMDIVNTQDIGVLFSTPPVLNRLAREMSDDQRGRIHGVHYGGLALAAKDLERFHQELFPNAVHLSGYGNTLFGCALELDATTGRSIRYFPHGHRLLLGITRDSETSYDAIGQRGPLVFSRLDHACMLINVLERDEVTLVTPPANAPEGFTTTGAETPEPIKRSTTSGQNLIY